MLMDPAPTITQATRRRGVEPTRSLRSLSTVVLGVLMGTTTTSAPPAVARSPWTVLAHGELTDLATKPAATRISAAESTSTPRTLLTMVTVAPMPTTTSSAPHLDALSL